MFVINPNEFILPSFGMTPFRTSHIAHNHKLPEDFYAVENLNNRFGEDLWKLTFNGREAIAIALNHYNLQKEDLVTVLTTSENFYISSCVTLEIDSVCKWNREILPETKVIFVNHEFGYPHPDMDYLVSLGIPIIEDCCTTFFSQDKNNRIGKYGDFAVYSLPKFFPIQIGGIVTSTKFKVSENKSVLTPEELQYIINVMSENLGQTQTILDKRRANFEYGIKLLATLGFTERLNKTDSIIPYAMLLKNNNNIKDLNAFKGFLYLNGIQNSTFYGEDGFFIPNNQSLDFSEIDYIYEVIRFYLNNNNS